MIISKKMRSFMIGFGLVFSFFGLTYLWDYISFSNGAAQSEGRVISIEMVPAIKGFAYGAKAIYSVDGVEYTAQDGYFTNVWKPNEGDTTVILYKINQPQISRIYFWSPFSLPLVFSLLGTCFLLTAFFYQRRE